MINKNSACNLYRYSHMVLCSVVLFFFCMEVRGNGLPGEYLLSDQWKIFQRYTSPMSNPALIMEQMYTSVWGAGAVSIDGVAKLWDLGVTLPIDLYSTVAISAAGEQGKSITSYSEELLTAGTPEVTSTSSNNNLLVMISYANNPFGKLSVGGNLVIATQSNFGDPTWAIGADIGASYRLLLHPFLGFHLIGISINNIIPPDVSVSKTMPYATRLRGQYHGAWFGRRFECDIQYDLLDLYADKKWFEQDIKRELNVALQGTIRPIPFIALKGFGNYYHHDGFRVGGLGSELNIPNVNRGRNALVIYQYMFNREENLQGTHTLYYQVDVGLHREEIYARKMASFGLVNANDLYNRAMKLYYEKKYWDAYLLYARLLTEFPDFFKNDMATYFSGSCLEEMDMREEGRKTYKHLMSTFPKTVITSWAELGKMRIFYRQGDYADALRIGSHLTSDTTTDSIKYHAYYLSGEIKAVTGNDAEAKKLLSVVPEHHPDYVFAQMSLSVLYAKQNESGKMYECLENCINAKTVTPGQKELVNKALLHIGIAFYEESSLSKAIIALRMIPAASIYYEDALIVSGWAAKRASQWNDCIDAGQKLIKTSKKIVLQSDGALLHAYGSIMLNRYADALVLLEHGIALSSEYPGVSKDSIETIKIMYDSDRMVYDMFGEQIAALAGRGKDIKKSDVDSLHNEQIRFQNKMIDYLNGFESAKRTLFYERNLSQVKDDLEYMIAKVQKMKEHYDSNRTNEKNMQKQDELSREIEKLKKEMEEIKPGR